ncbi:hypothetical protein [uncultured Hyphomicrobium sp.]|uniref:hypothetical protein n=1 Tax=uncultured Hyphomicrobium sp. TaxID=194373 RepID=UPI0025CDE6C4|nr:hypothetical protein [uncultured Hyphomicrobium sp.]
MIQRQPRQHHKGYLSALHELPCLRCGTVQFIEAAHIRLTNLEWEERAGVRTGAGAGEKPSDRWTLPLCKDCHREGSDAEHVVGTIAFYDAWGVDPHSIANALFTAYPDVPRMSSVALGVIYLNEHRRPEHVQPQ